MQPQNLANWTLFHNQSHPYDNVSRLLMPPHFRPPPTWCPRMPCYTEIFPHRYLRHTHATAHEYARGIVHWQLLPALDCNCMSKTDLTPLDTTCIHCAVYTHEFSMRTLVKLAHTFAQACADTTYYRHSKRKENRWHPMSTVATDAAGDLWSCSVIPIPQHQTRLYPWAHMRWEFRH